MNIFEKPNFSLCKISMTVWTCDIELIQCRTTVRRLARHHEVQIKCDSLRNKRNCKRPPPITGNSTQTRWGITFLTSQLARDGEQKTRKKRAWNHIEERHAREQRRRLSSAAKLLARVYFTATALYLYLTNIRMTDRFARSASVAPASSLSRETIVIRKWFSRFGHRFWNDTETDISCSYKRNRRHICVFFFINS